MGKKRRAIERLPCTMCGAAGFDPCINRRTGKPIKTWHCPRASKGRNDHLNSEYSKILGEHPEEEVMYLHLLFGGTESNYDRPSEELREVWDKLYRECPNYSPGQRYWGDW